MGSRLFHPVLHMRIAIYLLGVFLIIGGLAWFAISLGVPALWVGVGALVIVGFGLIGAATHTQYPDDVPASERRSI